MIDGLSKAPVGATIDEFEFEDAGRTFRCSAEAPQGSRVDGWWWFRVASDTRGQRYAPFRAASDDTRDDVQARVVAYYNEMLVRRTQPAMANHWGRRAGAPRTASADAPSADAAHPASPSDSPVV